MSNSYKISDNVDESFGFDIVSQGQRLDFEMRYPLTAEVDQVQEINTKLEAAQDKKRKAISENRESDAANAQRDIEQASKELEQFIYRFIKPVGHERDIQEVLKTQNIKAMKNFNTMIRAELSLN